MVAIAGLVICPFCINYINYKAMIKNSEISTIIKHERSVLRQKGYF